MAIRTDHKWFEVKGAPESRLRKADPFDFQCRLKRGPMLLVGEGNLSFSLALAKKVRKPFSLVATTYDHVNKISPRAKRNAETLKKGGVKVLHGVNATRLHKTFRRAFSTVVFQFPNTGDRRSVYGRTSNHHLVRRFLTSCDKILIRNG
ncbi:MAG: Rossmann-like fold-containing protein, partial [Pseudomonadota bacterium]